MNRITSTRPKFPPLTTWNYKLPFTASSLRHVVRPKLAQAAVNASTNGTQEEHGSVPNGVTRHAAVLIPLCNILNSVSHVYEPSILFTVRGSGLRTHSGEVSFPGGGVDSTDESYQAAAIRETHEELGIHPSRIEILGKLYPKETAKRADTLVHAFVGFVHRDSAWAPSSASTSELADQLATPPIEIEAARKHILSTVSPNLPREVDHVFHLPLSTLFHETQRRREGAFQRTWGMGRYWAVGVDDLVYGTEPSTSAPPSSARTTVLGSGANKATVDSELGVGGGDGTGLEIWGLTGWYLNQFLSSVFPEQWNMECGKRSKL